MNDTLGAETEVDDYSFYHDFDGDVDSIYGESDTEDIEQNCELQPAEPPEEVNDLSGGYNSDDNDTVGAMTEVDFCVRSGELDPPVIAASPTDVFIENKYTSFTHQHMGNVRESTQLEPSNKSHNIKTKKEKEKVSFSLILEKHNVSLL